MTGSTGRELGEEFGADLGKMGENLDGTSEHVSLVVGDALFPAEGLDKLVDLLEVV
jgi:hypothetical protein